jgi:hypothetical protein
MSEVKYTLPTGTRPKLTPDEERIVNLVAKSHGEEWAMEHLELILDEARSVGYLPEN